jgi:uncharacterized membrane protein YvbJ
MRPCPACGRKIQDAAQKCHYCGAPAPHPPRPGRAAPPALAEVERRPPPRIAPVFLIGAVVAVVIGLILFMTQG